MKYDESLIEHNEEDLCDLAQTGQTKPLSVKSCVQTSSDAKLFVKVIQKPKILTDIVKANTTEADLKKELKRGSMKEKWGLSLAFKIDGARISLLGDLLL